MDYCDKLNPILVVAKNVVNVIRFGVPILLIVLGSIDLAKAVISSKDDEMKKAQGLLIKRIIYAIAVFLVVTVVDLAIGFLGSDDVAGNWYDCWKGVNTNK